eukprot:CAMPEP_0117423974 /NCGR_PEP_ID=MMETSP0758-20121206/4494_1 /TAXON_ID=63605 /ORGANISM="Percolomonas cosmopolitus, Strain AE-1 (ATCC 50343)" /LENGTH=246 /DNA_ID=CAMNT_0005207491 /DNA_START=139 /DNA_END=876 /DNA_ORIENTATION=+
MVAVVVCLILLAVGVQYPLLEEYKDQEAYGKFVWISDIHLDPYYNKEYGCQGLCRAVKTNWGGCLCAHPLNVTKSKQEAPVGRYGCNTPEELLKVTVDAVKNRIKAIEDQSPEFMLLTGDFIAHGIHDVDQPRYSPIDIIKIVFKHFEQFDMPIYPIIGNCDVPEKDYIWPEDDSWAKELFEVWKPFLKGANTDAFVANGGAYYYVESLPGEMKEMGLIALNTNLFSVYQPQTPIRIKMANEQLNW